MIIEDDPEDPMPCPFCGSKSVAPASGDDGDHWQVECRFCWAEGPEAATSETAILDWNERAAT